MDSLAMDTSRFPWQPDSKHFSNSNFNRNKMNEMERLTEWVDYKIGKFLREDIEKIIVSEDCHFDTESYSAEMFERHFANAPEINRLKFEMANDKLKSDAEDVYLTDDFLQDSSDDDFRPASLDNVISDLQTPSEILQVKALESLQACSAEEIMAHESWTSARKLLQDLVKVPVSRKLSNKVLQLFGRFLSSKDTPKVVCEGFVSLAESIAFSIDAFNRRKSKGSKNEIFDFKTRKWVDNNLFREEGERGHDIEMIFKSMWLILNSQKGIPYKWIRFNEKRLREIAFSFIHMLSSSRSFKKSDCLCGLEILAVLDPKAKWCVNWCHGATGRILLCSALKTHKNLLNEIVEFILIRTKLKGTVNTQGKVKSDTGIKLPALTESQNNNIRSKSDNNRTKNAFENKEKYSGRLSVKNRSEPNRNRSAPPFTTDEYPNVEASHGEWFIKGIPRRVVNESMLCHCLSIVVYLIRYRSGRSLFPVEVPSRTRRVTVPDLTMTVLDYINGIVFFSEPDALKSEYKEHMLKLLEILKSLRTKMF